MLINGAWCTLILKILLGKFVKRSNSQPHWGFLFADATLILNYFGISYSMIDKFFHRMIENRIFGKKIVEINGEKYGKDDSRGQNLALKKSVKMFIKWLVSALEQLPGGCESKNPTVCDDLQDPGTFYSRKGF